jgi:DNA-binding response OmpR family regulator
MVTFMAESTHPGFDIASIISERQQITMDELEDLALDNGVGKEELKKSLDALETAKAIASHSNGGIVTYYSIEEPKSLSRVVIVEDDKNISKLMSIAVGKDLEVKQIYDGGEALPVIREFKPDLVILDLMLPNKNGLDICESIKRDPELEKSVVIIVSAMDPTSNRFKGIKKGADYYIKKPFDPKELRSLVTLFLRKKGKRFDPLIDLPDEERISKEVDRLAKQGESYTIGTLKIENLRAFTEKFGKKSSVAVLRLVSQLLQDAIREREKKVFVGFLSNNEFVIAGMGDEVKKVVDGVSGEYDAVTKFILQDEGYKPPIDLDIENLFGSKEVPRFSLSYKAIEKGDIIKRRDEILKVKGNSNKNIGTYTYEELNKMFGSDGFDVHITREQGGIRLHVGKNSEDEEKKQ